MMLVVREEGSISGSGRSPRRGNGNPLQYLPGKSHGQRSMGGYSPRGHKELDTTECSSTQTPDYFSLPLGGHFLLDGVTEHCAA